LNNDQSISVRNEAAFLLSKDSGIESGLEGLPAYLDWWTANKQKYTNMPAVKP
jgi:hypothetical protein